MSSEMQRYRTSNGDFSVISAHSLHDASAVQRITERAMPHAYANEEYGYSPQVIQSALAAQRGQYSSIISRASEDGSNYYLATNNSYASRVNFTLEGAIQGLCRAKKTDELGHGDALQIEELLVDPDFRRKRRASALLNMVIETDGVGVELLYGRILSYNIVALQIAEDLGMTKIQESSDWPFPRKKSLKNLLQKPPEWSYYGAPIDTVKEHLDSPKRVQ